jgi:uncharacterized spore protein YtfJ
MKVEQIGQVARDTLTVRRVFGEPIERDGTTVVPVAVVTGGGGGGGGHDDHGSEGEGGGFGMAARPAGVYVIRDGAVEWRPAIDVNRLVVTGAVVLVLAMLRRRRRR